MHTEKGAEENVIWKGLRYNCDNVNCDFSCLLIFIEMNKCKRRNRGVVVHFVWDVGGFGDSMVGASVSFLLSFCLSLLSQSIDVESTWKRTILMFMVYVWFCESHIFCHKLWNRFWHLLGCAYCCQLRVEKYRYISWKMSIFFVTHFRKWNPYII